MLFYDKVLSIDYTSAGLSSIEQLLFIKIAFNTGYGNDVSTKALCASCGCSKPTLHLSISKLEELKFIVVKRSPGTPNKYFVNNALVDSLLPEYMQAKIMLEDFNKEVEEFNRPKVMPKLTKNQRKRLNKRR